MVVFGFDGSGLLILLGDLQDLVWLFNYCYDFKVEDYVDFSVVGGMKFFDVLGGELFCDLYVNIFVVQNVMLFYCNDSLCEEIYWLVFLDGVLIVVILCSQQFGNVVGEYQVDWLCEGQVICVYYCLYQCVVCGVDVFCQLVDYLVFCVLYQQVWCGFCGQVVYGDLGMVQVLF